MKLHILTVASVAAFGVAKADVIEIDPGALTNNAIVDFEDLGLGDNESVNSDGIFESGTVAFSARFAGQTQGVDGDFDTLTSTANNPLSLENDVANQNVGIFDGADANAGNTSILGLGPAGFGTNEGIGEGSIAMLFDFDQSEFGIDIIGGNGGAVSIQFFQRDGSLLDELTVTDLVGATALAFRTLSGMNLIAGIAITNNDIGGVAFDNIRSDVLGNDDTVPVPPAAILMAGGLLALRRRRRRAK
ncbi:MAG: hypothetical protein AAF830_06810 [Pseudomonadota bacterium]